jgi:hypothetical protein
MVACLFLEQSSRYVHTHRRTYFVSGKQGSESLDAHFFSIVSSCLDMKTPYLKYYRVILESKERKARSLCFF